MTGKVTLCPLCKIRGRCCDISSIIEGFNIILSKHPCEYLDINTGLCTVYSRRTVLCDDCNPPIEENRKCYPKECLYFDSEDDGSEEYEKVKDKFSEKGRKIYEELNDGRKI